MHRLVQGAGALAQANVIVIYRSCVRRIQHVPVVLRVHQRSHSCLPGIVDTCKLIAVYILRKLRILAIGSSQRSVAQVFRCLIVGHRLLTLLLA